MRDHGLFRAPQTSNGHGTSDAASGVVLASPRQLEPGEVLGDYEILGAAGTGGMGVVYKARQRSLDRIVALKVIREEIARTPEYRERFLREAKLAASIDHPHVVSVFDVGDDDDCLFLAMQWVDGQDLKRLLESNGRLSPDRAVTIATQLASALDAVHGAAGLVHRDVKPANVLLRHVGNADHAYLTDFGVAKPSETSDHLTRTGWLVGTSGYLSPEQIRGEEPGPRSDLYALGCLFFETLTGRAPFVADNEMGLRWAHANQPRPLASSVVPDLGGRYDQFFAKALAIDPAQRFGSGREFSEALALAQTAAIGSAPTENLVQSHAPTAVGPATPLPPAANTPMPPAPAYAYTPMPPYPQSPRSGNPLALILLGIVALAGIAVGGLAAGGVFAHASHTKTITAAVVRPHKKTVPPPTKTAPLHPVVRPVPQTGTTPCGGGVSVGPNTSCGFAQNVAQAYQQTSGGNQTVTASSSATGQSYQINCTGGSPHVCTGGTTNNASVYFTSNAAPTSSSGSTPASNPGPGMTACDQNISVNSVTSCPFADNVFSTYANDYQSSGQSDDTVVASSPATGNTYTMNCTSDGTTVTCTGGNNAEVTFPLHAAAVY